MTQDEAFSLCNELEALVSQGRCNKSMLMRVREIEGLYFADVEADGQLLTQVTRVIDAIEEALCEARPGAEAARRFQLEGPVMEELARLRTAIRACYGRSTPYLDLERPPVPPAGGLGLRA